MNRREAERMSSVRPPRNPAPAPEGIRAGRFLLGLAYVCVAGLLVNLCVRLGWIHFRLPGLTGSAARWGWVLGAAVCFVGVWYIERNGRRPSS